LGTLNFPEEKGRKRNPYLDQTRVFVDNCTKDQIRIIISRND